MPKLKTHSGTKDRVRVTKTGKVVRRHTSGNHFLRKKSASRKRAIASTSTIDGRALKNTKLQLGEK